ncbi:hypothetical protein BO94DRAFT_532737 [Aspergillus sclerotioniger CBS 115572]|uniref:Uncharacterized protein n=1 Tax=Aspergillus sclerotioniger CBS 115572 TaxID=1450535 RepID=A0A317X659_9EURO|nr:hypothetical protein BO94DRAFT_532737 [Aspergillus sclerotioniger CBS 115572]PWY93795.1 hypothetical protein BO94DRAFT_532737 [Aspergillus sclerotioniger CBS 115572]
MSTPPDNDAAYHDLAHIFSARHQDNRVLEIEILPPGLGPLLQDGDSIGITKKHLVQAFVTARRIFFDASYNASDFHDASDYEDLCKTPRDGHPVQRQRDDLLNATEIILLFDCEHLTACNWRKKRLAGLVKRYGSADADQIRREMLIRELDTELSLMTSYLCSPLHRHTKSPTLWNHRLMVLTRVLDVRNSELAESFSQREDKGLQEVIKKELSVVLRSGELHPRNYYAFNYVRQLLELLPETCEDTKDAAALRGCSVIHLVLDWCLAHPSDISGWMFTLYLLETVHDEQTRTDSIARVLRFAVDVGWEGESLWTFVDLAKRIPGAGTLTKDQQCRPPWDVFAAPFLSDAGPEKGWKAWLGRARAAWIAGHMADNRADG